MRTIHSCSWQASTCQSLISVKGIGNYLLKKRQCLTAFQTPLGLYQFKVMSFGLVNASASFSRLMRKLLEGMQFIDNLIEDVIIYTQSFQEHLQIVEKV